MERVQYKNTLNDSKTFFRAYVSMMHIASGMVLLVE